VVATAHADTVMNTAAQTEGRRSLAFADLSEVMPEVRRLMGGHRTVGNWSLAQVCKHLADSFTGSMDGFRTRRHLFKRLFLRKVMLRRTYAEGIPPNYTVLKRLNPPPNCEIQKVVEELGRSIERFEAHQGRLHFHPLFGSLDRAGWDRLHRFHSAHHLSFVIQCESAGQRST
jgi:hypothetical protein